MNWPWQRKTRNWEIRPFDLHWLGQELSFIVVEGWEPFALSITGPDQPIVWFRRKA